MTIRSVLIGLLLAALLGAITLFNDTVLRNTHLIGNFLPVSVFGLMVLILLLINPLLRKAAAKAAFTGRELAVIIVLALFACFIPGGGLLHSFTQLMMWPHRHVVLEPSWHSGEATIYIGDIRDHEGFVARLVEGDSPAAPELLKTLFSSFPDESRDALQSALELPEVPTEVIEKMLEDLNALMARGDLFAPEKVAALNGPRWFRRLAEIDPDKLSRDEIILRNRGVIDILFRGVIEIRRAGALEATPPQMLTDLPDEPEDAIAKYTDGIDLPDRNLRLSDVPWGPWARPLMFWVPLVLCIVLATAGLALVLHRQWASHEHLHYPIVEFARALIPSGNETKASILKNKTFFIGLFFVLTVHLVNYAHLWWPDYLIPFQTRFDLRPLVEIFPIFEHSPTWYTFNPRIFFTAVAFAFFLASDVSLSLGIAPYMQAILLGVLASYGMTLPYQPMEPTVNSSIHAGAYFGFFMVLAYTGRHYYRKVFMSSVGLHSGEGVESHAIWGARIFLIFIFLFILQMVRIGLDWPVAIFYTMAGLVIYVVVSRLLAEAGVFFIRSWFAPCAVVWGVMGATALGPDQQIILAIVTVMLLADPREAFMPFAMTGICLADRAKLKISRATSWGLVALMLALAVGVPAALYFQYRQGSSEVGGWWFTHFPVKMPYDVNIGFRDALEAQDALQESYELSGLERYKAISPVRTFVTGFSIMMVVVIAFAFMRYRFAWWPLHPLIFLVMGTWPSTVLGSSFLLGWVIKSIVTRYGGAQLYRKAKPMMIGLIAGDMLAALIILVIGAIYYFETGQRPQIYRVTPT